MSRTYPSLRGALVTMVAVLASYGSALYVEHAADLHVDVVVQAVVLSWTVAWVQRAADTRTLLITFIVLPAVAVAGVEVAVLMTDHPAIGDPVFVGCFFLSIWVRRFGPLATRAGTLAVLPLVATLVLVLQAPLTPPFDDEHTVWVAVIALISAGWVTVIVTLAARLRLVERTPVVAPSGPPEASPPGPSPPEASPPGTATTAAPGGPRRPRVSAHTRMAFQMAVALGAAFPIGRHAFPDHWAWVVLTAFIVCSGARARGDVLHRGLLRALGAGVGTAVATWIAGILGPDDARSVVLIFVILAVATWLRPLSYAYWAGCVTAMLSLLYGYFGESAPSLLRTRLAAILVGAAIGIAASWLILPIRTGTVVRRRSAEALAALAALLAEERWDPAVLDRHRVRFEHAVRQLGQVTRPVEAYRRLIRGRRPGPHYADAWGTIRQLVPPARTIVRCAEAKPDLKAEPALAALAAAVLANISAVRLLIGKRPGRRYQPLPRIHNRQSRVVAALAEIDEALATLDGIFADGQDAGRPDAAASRKNPRSSAAPANGS